MFIPKTYSQAIQAFDELVLQFCMRGKYDIATYFVVNFIFDIYYTLNLSVFSKPEAQQYLKKINQKAKFFYNRYKNTLFKSMDEETKEKMALDVKNYKIKQDFENGFTIKFTFKE